MLLDQRGVGKSRPKNELKDNTTQHLSDDIEKLREHLDISKWHLVFGGSWGSTLGLFYAQAYPERVGSLVLRGVFLVRKSELRHNGQPASLFFPQEWDNFLKFLPEEERSDPMNAYYARITSKDRDTSIAAAKEWNRWDMFIGSLRPDTASLAKIEDPEWSLTHALFETHYLFQNGAWLEDGQLLFPENMEKIKDIPCKTTLPKEFCDYIPSANVLVQVPLFRGDMIWYALPSRLGTCTRHTRSPRSIGSMMLVILLV